MTDEFPLILVVEDDRDLQMMISKILKNAQYRVREASDGEEAMKLVRSGPPDLVLMDVTMPRMDGFEVCARMKDDPALESIPVILITGLSDYQARIKGLDMGAN